MPRAVKDGGDMEARTHIAFANTVSGVVMTLSLTTRQHSIEHAMSAYHHDLPHGAGLIMISRAFMGHFVRHHGCDERFVRMARAMGKTDASKPEDFITALVDLQKACGVDRLKMSDYGITPDEFMKIAANAKETMGGLFTSDRVPLSTEDCAEILKESYR
ncbi:MAG: iron-containing alcohol dehydrogenase [Victivallaceae bacterium]|nr:iron-containing alcohol dehydrogenase [Victivallaceae bacterium]